MACETCRITRASLRKRDSNAPVDSFSSFDNSPRHFTFYVQANEAFLAKALVGPGSIECEGSRTVDIYGTYLFNVGAPIIKHNKPRLFLNFVIFDPLNVILPSN